MKDKQNVKLKSETKYNIMQNTFECIIFLITFALIAIILKKTSNLNSKILNIKLDNMILTFVSIIFFLRTISFHYLYRYCSKNLNSKQQNHLKNMQLFNISIYTIFLLSLIILSKTMNDFYYLETFSKYYILAYIFMQSVYNIFLNNIYVLNISVKGKVDKRDKRNKKLKIYPVINLIYLLIVIGIVFTDIFITKEKIYKLTNCGYVILLILLSLSMLNNFLNLQTYTRSIIYDNKRKRGIK